MKMNWWPKRQRSLSLSNETMIVGRPTMGGEDGEKVDQRQERLSIMGERKKILKGKINISKFNHYRENIYFSKKKKENNISFYGFKI